MAAGKQKQIAPATPDQIAEALEGPLSLAQGAGLSALEQMAAVYEASGKFSVAEVARQIGRSTTWLYKLRANVGYQTLVQRIIAQLASRVAATSVDLDTLFNQQVRHSVATLIEIRDNPFNKAQDRAKAANSLIDRAPATPRPKESKVANVILSIPVQHMKTVQTALIEEGEGELVDLISGRDFEELKAPPVQIVNSSGEVVEFDSDDEDEIQDGDDAIEGESGPDIPIIEMDC